MPYLMITMFNDGLANDIVNFEQLGSGYFYGDWSWNHFCDFCGHSPPPSTRTFFWIKKGDSPLLA